MNLKSQLKYSYNKSLLKSAKDEIDKNDGGAFYQCQCDDDYICPGCNFVAYLKARNK